MAEARRARVSEVSDGKAGDGLSQLRSTLSTSSAVMRTLKKEKARRTKRDTEKSTVKSETRGESSWMGQSQLARLARGKPVPHQDDGSPRKPLRSSSPNPTNRPANVANAQAVPFVTAADPFCLIHLSCAGPVSVRRQTMLRRSGQ